MFRKENRWNAETPWSGEGVTEHPWEIDTHGTSQNEDRWKF